MTITEFIAKWRKVELKERSAAQEHFIDLCNLFEHPTPAAADPTGENFCFEKGAAKHGGGDGFADVWKRGFFGWEYKGKHKELNAAYDQLLRYRNALESPPLLVVCDLDRLIVHTNFTGTVSTAHEIPLESLGEPRNIEIMRAVFHDPEVLRPGRTSLAVTQEVAQHFAGIAASMRERGLDAAAVAHFLDRIVFCLFAEDTGLLPEMVFTRMAKKSEGDPARFGKLLGQLFETMANGGDFGLESIRHFNGNLFDDRTVIELNADDIERISEAASLDWSYVDPSIFGTLFERGLDPAKRSQLGAHFTSREDIELIVDAVIMTSIRREWDECRTEIEALLSIDQKKSGGQSAAKPAAIKKAQAAASLRLHRFLERLQNIRILDPSCGSGNFLYVSLLRLKDLEKEIILYGSDNGLGAYLPLCGPWQLFGIEVNPYAHDLAQMTVWIGWLQWIRSNGFGYPAEPILRPLTENIRLMDAIMTPEGQEPEWPAVDFIVGNPPFLGDKLMRRELGGPYVDQLHSLFTDCIPGQSDLCCYWFEKARAHIAAGKCKRAGLLATQGIRGGANREVLKRIKESGGIFWAESDRPWVLDGANVHVSMVGFDDKREKTLTLDGKPAATINANLTSLSDITTAQSIAINQHISYQGVTPAGPFIIHDEHAQRLLLEPSVNRRPNSDVLRPYLNAEDIARRNRNEWIVDFGVDTPENSASGYDSVFQYALDTIKPFRQTARSSSRDSRWWLHLWVRHALRSGTQRLASGRYIATPRVSKHRVFVFVPAFALVSDATFGFIADGDHFFGVLHSRFHEAWALAQGTQLREKESGFRYTPTTCFETFPFPETHADRDAVIAAAAKELNELRENWLNPPEWTKTECLEFPGTVGGPWDRYIDPATVEDRGAFKVGVVRYSRTVARDTESAKRLKDRTLTKLYNERPAWLAACHAKLDRAVAAAYGWPADLTDEQILERLLTLNLAHKS